MSIGIINKVNVNSVSSESKGKHSMSVFCGLDIENSIPEAIKDFSKIRLRVVVSYSKHSNQVMDFISQRFNEFKALEKTDKNFGTSIPTPEYVSYLKDDLNSKNLGDPCEPSYKFLEESSPLSPFSTKSSFVTSMFKNNFVYSDGKNIPVATAMYDSPVEFLLSSKFVKNLKNGIKPDTIKSELQLDPIHFSFADTDLDKINDLSVYAYVYEMMEGSRGVSKISLSTGMTEVSSVTLKGEKTSWNKITPDDPYIGIGFVNNEFEFPNTTIQVSPDASKFISLNIIGGLSVIGEALADIDENLSQRGRGFTYHESGYKIIKDSLEEDNFFSNLWMTKDSHENRRFIFGFDLESYLAANSIFPYLYKNSQTSAQLLNDNIEFEKSRVMNISVSRFFIGPHSNLPINELGTNGYSTILGPDSDFPEKIIRDVKRSSVIIPKLQGAINQTTIPKDKIQLYEAKDILNTNLDPHTYNDGCFRYGVNYTVYDASISFLRNLTSLLLNQQNTINDVYDTIVRNSLYNTETGYLFASPDKIPVYSRYGKKQQTLDVYLSNALSVYEYVVSSLLQNSPSLDYFSQRFEADNLEIKYIRELLEQIKAFTHLLTRKLSEVAPNDPLGRRPNLSKAIEFKAKGLMEFNMPVMRGRHFFDHKEVIGKDYDFGLDYMFIHEGDEGDHNGLSLLSVEEYDNRLGHEVSKHFYTGQPGNISSPLEAAQSIAPLLGESSFRYFTPYIVRTPNTNNKIFQNIPDTIGESVYPINRYAKMFVDIFKQKNSVDSDGLKDPLSMSHNRRLSPNGTLYKAVTSVLDMYHSCEFNDSPEVEYPPLKVIKGEKENTTNFESIFKFDPISFSSGPLAIPSIIGGNSNLGSTVESYFTGVNNSLSSQYDSKGVGYEDQKNENLKEIERPIKLPFAIFGELSVDKDIVLSIREQDKIFNSIKQLTSDLGYFNGNLEQIFDDTLGIVPNSMKSLLLIAATNDRQSLLNASLDTNRPVLEDKDPDQENQSIAISIFGDQNSLQMTGDPMKIYAKFMAFWMNYKQVSVVEYLDGFASLKDDGPYDSRQDSTRLNKLALPEWTPLDSFTVQNVLKTRDKILCRVRNYSLADYLSRAFPQVKRSPFIDYGHQIYDFPVYNKYFYLGYEEPVFTEEEKPTPFLTTENECHNHSYYVDEKGNGWTSMAVSPNSSNIMHRHQIINFEVQSAQSDCYPHCEVKYGAKGVGPHEHKLTNTPKIPTNTSIDMTQMTSTSQMTMTNTSQVTTTNTSLFNNGSNDGY